ncbi:hypothetical protein HYS11_01090 [Candidatus Gottesmanbacteria bacterium]|nr:hypothetical protein [Candidatus Gottesmanbacteria bacterium]
MSDLQLLIASSIVILTILSTIIGIQVSFIFRDLKRMIDRMDKVLTHLQHIGSAMTQPLHETLSHKSQVISESDAQSRPVEKSSLKHLPSLRKRFFRRGKHTEQ